MYRAFYLPPDDISEVSQDNTVLNQLPSGAILVIQINEDGTRQVISEKKNQTPAEKRAVDYAKRQLEFKHDGGPSYEVIAERRKRLRVT